MRKLAAGILLASLVMTAGATVVSASEVTYGRHYADVNQDGICDYCGQAGGCNLEVCNSNGRYFVDEDGDGICDYANGRYFVDEDGDGICDNAKAGSCQRRNGGNGRHGNTKGGCHRGRCGR